MTKSTETREFLGPVWIYILALVLFFIRFGYGFAIGDQDEIVPYLLRVLNPTLFENDWFVQAQAAGITVRSYFVFLLVPFSYIMTVEIAVLVVYLALWFAIAAGAYHLVLTFGLTRLSAAGAVVVGLGILHKWTLGSNDLVYSMLVPEMAAWALALPAIRLKVLGRNVLCAVLLGTSAWFQILVGILVFGILVLEQIWSLVSSGISAGADRRNWRILLRDVVIFGVAALPVLVPILGQQLQAPAGDAEPSIFYILAPFRNPVHHMFFSFPLKSVIRFVLLVAGAWLSLRWLDRRELVKDVRFLYRLGGLVILGSLVMIVFTEWMPVLFIAKFQAYKLTVLFKLLAVALMGAVLVEVVPPAVVHFFDGLLVRGRARFVTTLGIVAASSAVWLVAPSVVNNRLSGRVHSRSDLGQMERWIAGNSDEAAVFAIPPSNSSFRSNARRAIVVNFMAFPYNDTDIIEWYSRIQAVAPIGMVESGLRVRPKLDSAFESLEADELRYLATRYDFEYVLRRRVLEDFEAVKSIGAWTLFRVR